MLADLPTETKHTLIIANIVTAEVKSSGLLLGGRMFRAAFSKHPSALCVLGSLDY